MMKYSRLAATCSLVALAAVSSAKADSRPLKVVINEDNITKFERLEGTPYTCYREGGTGQLGVLTTSRLRVWSRWRALSTRTLELAEAYEKGANQGSYSRRQRREYDLLSQAKARCAGSGTPINTPTPRPTVSTNPQPGRTPTPGSIPTARPTAIARPVATPPTQPTIAATPTVAATATHNHSTPGDPNRTIPPLAASNNRPGTRGITTLTLGSPVEPLRGGPTRDTFRTRVAWTHLLYDDPIVFPGQAGASHLHMFFGNALVDATTTKDNIRSRCRSAAGGGIANCSAYWIPAVMNSRGEALAPDFSLMYYKAGYQATEEKDTMPPTGLAMITGNPQGSPTNGLNDSTRYNWYCQEVDGPPSKSIPNCPAGGVLRLQLEFPSCWNGRDLGWDGDHKSHMTFGDGRRCPASHPVKIPTITYNAVWRVPSSGIDNWRLSSDMYPAGSGNPGGHSMHGDWVNGWDPEIMQTFITNCNNREIDCVIDNLGDGRHTQNGHLVSMYK